MFLGKKVRSMVQNKSFSFYISGHLKGQSHCKKTAMEMLDLFSRMEKSLQLLKIPLLQGKKKSGWLLNQHEVRAMGFHS